MEERKKEKRFLKVEKLEVRTQGEGDNPSMTVFGYAVMWNQRSQLIWDTFYEVVAKGAFTKALEQNTIKALWNHNTDYVLGSTKPATLRLKEDDKGLYFEIDLPNNDWGRNAFESIRRGDVDGVSFGFYVNDCDWLYMQDEEAYLRTLLEIDLFEISPTPFPAYLTSEVDTRSMELRGIKSREQRRAENAEIEKLKMELDLLEIA